MHVLILGTRGIPANHGGFETFAQDLALFLVSKHHQVTVYCQAAADEVPREDVWNGVGRVFIPAGEGSAASVGFDWHAIRHAARQRGVVILSLGYNTAIFNFLFRLRARPTLMNMDGVEWKRDKWNWAQRTWLRVNEWAGARFSHHLIADHPEIRKHLMQHTASEKITMIPYGADAVLSAPLDPVSSLGLSPKSYDLIIARPEPENSILEIVRAHASRERNCQLVVLGDYTKKPGDYKRRVLEAGNQNVKFIGAIYDQRIVKALRFHCRTYIHGHRVGGTNPSLVESLAASNPILAHDNPFNRWVAGDGGQYFKGEEDLAGILDSLEALPSQLHAMEIASRKQHEAFFTRLAVLSAYEKVLLEVGSTHGAVDLAMLEVHQQQAKESSTNPVLQ